jgi:hypothetical protein
MVLNEFCDTSQNHLWNKGNARFELFVNRTKVVEYYFEIGDKNEFKEISIAQNDNVDVKERGGKSFNRRCT